jgi:large subunit ribosomal protein L25
LGRHDVLRLIKSPGHLADLDIDGATETVLIRDVQWDHLGKEIIHLDFARVNVAESIETEVRLDVKGTAPGVAEGGVLEVIVHDLRITCRANAIPDAIKVDVSHLHLDEEIKVKDLTLPAGVTIDADPELLLIHVSSRAPAPEPAPSEVVESLTQPEVIKPERREKEE